MDRRSIEAIYPLSPMQRGMLFHTLYAPGARAYFEQLVFALEGPLDVPSFIRTWQQVFDRHPIFRTQVVWKHRDEPLQLVRRQVRLPWVQHDCRGLSPDGLKMRLDALCRADQEQGFDLASTPLARLTLIEADDQLHYLIWSFHHALLDRWSVGVVMKEVSHLYEAFVQCRDPSLPPSASYQEYVRWGLRQDRSRAEAFWTRALKDFTSPSVLRADSGPGAVSRAPTYRQQKVRLSPAATSALGGFARAHHLTLNTLVQGAWALVLSRDAGRDDVVHGVTVTTRPAELGGVDAMVGCLINTLPVRTRVPTEESVLSWLRRLQVDLLELREYDYSSLVDIQGWSQVPRGLPMFESIVVFENIPLPDPATPESKLAVRLIRSNEPRTGYPLTIVAVPDNRELLLAIIHDSDRFEAAAVTRLLRDLETSLEWMAAAPDRPLSALPVADHNGEPAAPASLARSEARAGPVDVPLAPRTAAEVTLAGIWAEVLGVKRVGRHDDFFALGGHSLRAMQVASRVRDAFGLELPLATIFEAPTLAGLAQRIEAAGRAGPGANPVTPPLRPRVTQGYAQGSSGRL
jgi:acyl carrier protein